jgi:hypothetical protein
MKSLILIGYLLVAVPVFGQTVTDKARAEIVKEKEDARIAEAKRLLRENDEAWARISKNNDRLVALESGAEPEKITSSISGSTGTIRYCTIN